MDVGCPRIRPAGNKEQPFAEDMRNVRMGKVAE